MALTITVVDNVTSVEVVEEVITITEATPGPQGATGPAGPTGATGAQGPSGVIGVTAPITNSGTSTAAQIGINQTALAITPSQVSGTAYTVANKVADEYRLANTLDIVPRSMVTVSRNMANGTVYYVLFTPSETITISNITVYCTTGGTDSGGTSVRRMGLFTATGTDNTTLTLVARTASDATIGNTTGTIYTRALDTTGGYPSSYTLNAGTVYAFGVIGYNTGGTYGIPSLAAFSDLFPQLKPYRILTRGSQTDLANTTGQSVGGAAAVFARLT